MTRTYYTSDLHIGHRTVAALRGFDTPEAHDWALAEMWDGMVSRDDIVWVLGDISVGGVRPERDALTWIRERPGVKHLVSGNHDSCHPMRSHADKALRQYLDGAFTTVQAAATRRMAKQRVLLSHFPFRGSEFGDHTPTDRFDEWRLPPDGENADRWLLHGHTHSHHQRQGRQLHVGLDAHGLRLVPQTWIEDLIWIEENEYAHHRG